MPEQRRQQQWPNAGNDASACRNCFMTGQMPVCDAGGNARATRSTMPAQQGQKHVVPMEITLMDNGGKYNLSNKNSHM
jgi:hypothetical protein